MAKGEAVRKPLAKADETPKRASHKGGSFIGLDPRRSTEVVLFVCGPAALFAIVLGVLDGLTYPVELLPDHDLTQVVLLMAVVAALALVDIFTHGFLLQDALVPAGRPRVVIYPVMITYRHLSAKG